MTRRTSFSICVGRCRGRRRRRRVRRGWALYYAQSRISLSVGEARSREARQRMYFLCCRICGLPKKVVTVVSSRDVEVRSEVGGQTKENWRPRPDHFSDGSTDSSCFFSFARSCGCGGRDRRLKLFREVTQKVYPAVIC